MPVIIQAQHCLEAWQSAVQHLLQHEKTDQNLIIEIADPTYLKKEWLEVYNPTLIDKHVKSVRDVANTIFPQKTFLNSRPNNFYQRYLKAHRRAKNPSGIWGTYFLRLISFGESSINQLENVISRMKKWGRNHKAAFVFHLSSADTDNPRPRGGPCWQFGELSCRGKYLDFIVVYRSHDYFSKAFGNFIGLGRLLNFISKKTGKKPGKIVCHSVHAFVGKSSKSMNKLIKGSYARR